MPTSERGNETIPITIDEFMGEIVHSDPGEARHIVVSFPGDPRGVHPSVWQGQPWTSSLTLSETYNNFYSLGSFGLDADGQLHRRIETFRSLHCFVLDDIGSKVDPGLIHLPPSYKIETSLNNYQWGFILREPERDAVLVNALMNAAIAARLSDKGMTQPSTRLVRLPVGMNGKGGKNFPCRLRAWNQDLLYSVEDLIRGLGLDLDHTTRQKPRPRGSHTHGTGNPTGAIEPLLSRLERVRQLSPDSFLACCPAHDDQHPSLSIKVTLDKTLLHCHAGCSVSSICTALGIEMKDLFLDTGYPVNGTPHSASTASKGTSGMNENPSQSTTDEQATKEEPPTGLASALLEYAALVTLDLPTRKHYLPWLPEGGNVMVYGPRGIGKTFFELSLTASLVTGTQFLKWPISEAAGVLYIDGEMQLDELRGRMTNLLPEPPKAPLHFLSSEMVYHRLKRDLILSSVEVRDEVIGILDAHPEIRVLIFDNISCLFAGLDEDKKRDWEPIAAWFIRLRHRGLSTVLVHHAGKGGQQRGTSGREDALDTVIALSRPSTHEAKEGCHFEVKFEKCRSVKGDDVGPLDVKLTEKDSRLIWTYKDLELSKEEQVRELLKDGLTSNAEIAEALGISRTYVWKLRKKIQKGGGQ